jgi:hypothetical protein
MALSQENKQKIELFLRDYFANNRSLTTFEIIMTLQEDNPDIFELLKDASVKMNEENYLNRYILPKFKKEGWLSLIKDEWKVQLSHDRCTYCFQPLNQIYVIDIDLNRYCSWECTEKCRYYAEPYENNLDMYSFLFDRFERLLPRCLFFNNNTPFSQQTVLLELGEIVKEIVEIVEDSYYDYIRFDKGKESCVDLEIYRMLTILDQQYERLKSLLTRTTNIGICTQCQVALDEKYIVNQSGDLFCSEDCIEDYFENHETMFSPHPYEDQYFAIRREYIYLLENWEQQLSSKKDYLEAAVDELYEEIDELIDEYYDFILSEGDDGIYAQEIYQFTMKLRDLQKKIFAWHPNRKTYFWISTELGLYGSNEAYDQQMFQKITTALYLDGYGEDILLDLIKTHAHPFHLGCNLVFDCYEDALAVFDVLKPYFEQYDLELSIRESYRCEAGCGDIVDNGDKSLFLNGFFYCYPHSESGDYGLFSENELKGEVEYYSDNESERIVLIEGKQDWCYPFKEKIKRSCRTYQIEIPDWALN